MTGEGIGIAQHIPLLSLSTSPAPIKIYRSFYAVIRLDRPLGNSLLVHFGICPLLLFSAPFFQPVGVAVDAEGREYSSGNKSKDRRSSRSFKPRSFRPRRWILRLLQARPIS
jgi:hypothetical protein